MSRFKNNEMFYRIAEGRRIEDILLPLQDGDRVAETLTNVGFSVEHFFNPSNFAV